MRKFVGAMAAAAMVALVSVPTASEAREQVAFAGTYGEATAPIGWLQFCTDGNHRRDCEGANLRAQAIELDERKWGQILVTNARVNAEIEPITDQDQWGVPEVWSYPTTGKGDCEDYVLEKRRRLIAQGFPRQSLMITVVRDHKGDGHAVLMVRTDRGDFILDNQEQQVLLWSDTGYKFIKRQAETNPARWVSLGNAAAAILTAQNRR